MNIRKNNGITLVALVITIVLLLIIASISITGTMRGQKQTQKSVALTELNMVQHAILERYTKLTKETLPGQSVTSTQLQQEIDEIEEKSGATIALKGNTEDYKLLDFEALQDLGMENYKSEYIVNYSTGEVIDITRQVTEDGTVLYISSSDTEELNYVKEGLVLHLDGINNTGNGHSNTTTMWKDLSGNDGKLNNYDNTDYSGRFENGISFDGINDVIEVAESDTISPKEQTIEIILQKDGDSNTTDGRQIFFVKWKGYTMEINKNNTISYGRNSGYLTYLTSNKTINLSEKYSIVAKHENNISRLYINNIFEKEQNVQPIAYSMMKTITIGNYAGNGGQYLNGKIYSIRMYNRALTDSEMEHNYEIDKERFNLE